MRYLGIDYGSQKIGLALSDEAGSMGFPHAIVPNTPRVVGEICARIAREGVGAVVVGESRDFSGKENAIAKDARAFAELLGKRAGIPIFFEPEDLTSAQARRQYEQTEKNRKPKKRVPVDASAAALILTSYLSHAHDQTSDND